VGHLVEHSVGRNNVLKLARIYQLRDQLKWELESRNRVFTDSISVCALPALAISSRLSILLSAEMANSDISVINSSSSNGQSGV
jgi:hypothetical protein